MKTLARKRETDPALELLTDGYWPVKWRLHEDKRGNWKLVGHALGMDEMYELDELLLLGVKVHYRAFDPKGSRERLIETMTIWGRSLGDALETNMKPDATDGPTSVHRILRTLLRATHLPFTTSRCDKSLHYLLHAVPLSRAAEAHDVTLDAWHMLAFEVLLTAAIMRVCPTATTRFALGAGRNIGSIHVGFADPAAR